MLLSRSHIKDYLILPIAICLIISAPQRIAAESNIVAILPPVSIECGPIEGTDSDRKAIVTIVNNGTRTVKSLVAHIYRIKRNGEVSPPIKMIRPLASIEPGMTYTSSMNNIHLTRDTGSIQGYIAKLTYDNGGTWPSLLANPPSLNGTAAVQGVFLGILGKEKVARPACAFFNYSGKEVSAFTAWLEWVNDSGKVIDVEAQRCGTGEKALEFDPGRVVIFGAAPPRNAVAARVLVKRIETYNKTSADSDARTPKRSTVNN